MKTLPDFYALITPVSIHSKERKVERDFDHGEKRRKEKEEEIRDVRVHCTHRDYNFPDFLSVYSRKKSWQMPTARTHTLEISFTSQRKTGERERVREREREREWERESERYARLCTKAPQKEPLEVGIKCISLFSPSNDALLGGRIWADICWCVQNIYTFFYLTYHEQE